MSIATTPRMMHRMVGENHDVINSKKKKLSKVDLKVAFVTKDLITLRSLDELSYELKVMKDQTFDHHVTGERNDFANWVHDVIGDATLAKRLEKAPDRLHAIKIVDKRINELRDDVDRIKKSDKAVAQLFAEDPKPYEQRDDGDHPLLRFKANTIYLLIGVLIGFILGIYAVGVISNLM